MKNHQYKDPQEETPLEDEPGEDESGDEESSLNELDFSDEPPPPTFGDLENDPDIESDDVFTQARNAGLTEAALPGQGPTADDLTPETLIHEDGAISPHEQGGDQANDQHLTIIDEGDMDEDSESGDEEDVDNPTQLGSAEENELDDEDLALVQETEAYDDELNDDLDGNEDDDSAEDEDNDLAGK
ncbi:MAG: hypothetical protein V4660_18300 [Pseudomonadota bacterium]